MRRDKSWNVEPDRLNRADRLDLQVPMRYRPVDECGSWREDTTENISATGVLVRADEELARDSTPLDISFVLPVELGGDGETEIVCRAHPVRAESPSVQKGARTLAFAITEYCLRRDPAQWPETSRVTSSTSEASRSNATLPESKAA
jgi:hypothetical protein